METESDSAVLWERRFSDLRAWKEKHGDCNVPKAEGKLGRWVVRQRELRKKGKLEGARAARLDALRFVWNTNEAAWEHKYALLIKYNERHRHCCVPISDPTLGMWVAKMRANRRRNKLAQHRIEKLDALNFVWNTAEADWLDKYARLRAFRVGNGHSCVPFNEGELGWWVNTQRQNKRKGKLAAHREALLNEAAFVWNPQQFLAARRRHAAAARASAHLAPPHYPRPAHGLYPAPAPPQPLAYVQHPAPAIAAPHCSNPRKRRQSTYYETPVDGAYSLASTSLSPVSVKRVKLTNSPHSPATHTGTTWSCHPQMPLPTPVRAPAPPHSEQAGSEWGGYYSHAPLPAPVGPAQLMPVKYSGEETREGCLRLSVKSNSIASLLSPIPKQPSPVSVSQIVEQTEQVELAKLRDGEARGGLDVLSSICGMPMVNSLNVNAITGAVVQSNGGSGERAVLSLPPISSLRAFNVTASKAGAS